MEIKEIPIPTMPDWLKLYNTYDPEYYAPGKRVSAEEWNTLFLASVRQGNYNADTLELLIKTYLPETYLTQVDFNQFSNEMRTAYNTFTNNIQEGFIAHKTQVQEQYDTFTTQVQEDFTALTSEVNSLEERVVKAEGVAYSLNDVIQEANEYAQAANQTAIESNTFAQEANANASTALETANSAASTAASSNNTAQDALSTAQSAVTTANNAATQATQAVNTANAASLRAEDAIATANAAKAESAAAKNTAAQAETTANASNTTAASANNTASEAKRIAQNALDLVTEGQGSQVIVNGVAVDTFNADTKADLDYVDRQIAALIGAAPETLDTLEEVAKAIKENETVVDALNAAIGTKANKADIEPTIQFAESERQKSKNLFNSARVPITSGSLEYNVETNTFIYTITETIESSGTGFVILKYGNLSAGTYTMSFDVTSTIGNTAPVIVAKLDEYDNFSSSIATKNIIDGYVYLTFTLTEETNIGLAWYYKAGWIAGDAPPGVKTLTNLQLEEGSVATDYQPYNGAITHNGDAPVVFAESEYQKSKNLFNATTSEVTRYSMTYSADTSKLYISGDYTDGARCQFATRSLKAGTYTLCIGYVSGTISRFSAIKFFLYKGTSWTQYAGCPDMSSSKTKVSVTFTLDEDVDDATLMLYQNVTNTMTDCVFQYQIVEGSNADFDFQPYNGAIVRDKQLTEQLSNYLPLSGGTLTGQLKLASDGLITNANDGYSIDKWGNLNALSSDAGALFKINSYDKSKSLTYAWNTGLLTLPSIPKVNDVNVALLSDLNSYLPLSGGTMTGAILFSNNATYSSTTQPTALSYGRLQAYGTLNINGNTDNSGTEYVNITAGHGCSSSTADGLSIGTDTLTWKEQPVIHSGNIQSFLSSYVTKDSSNIINNVAGMYGRLFGDDTRSVNGAPSTYQSQPLSMSMGIEFKSASTISAPNSNEKGFVILQTINPWGDTSGGLPSQLSYGNGLAYRTASSSSDWNSWRTIIDSTGGTISGTLTISGSINLIV